MNGFITKLDFSDNRQMEQDVLSSSNLSGTTNFGVSFDMLPSGPDVDTQEVVYSGDSIISTFTATSSGNIFVFGDSDMYLGEDEIPIITSAIAESTEVIRVGPVYTPTNSIVVDDNNVNLSYSGVYYTILVLNGWEQIDSETITGNTVSYVEKYEATGLDYSGRTIWVEVSGISRTDKIIVQNLSSTGGTTDVEANSEGMLIPSMSDIRLKENIKPINYGLNTILKLNPVTFEWKDDRVGVNLGLIANEVKEYIPEIVNRTKDGLYSLNYKTLIPVLIKAIQEICDDGFNKSTLSVEHRNDNLTIEDNIIDLNFNGTHKSALYGGIRVIRGVDEETDSLIVIDKDGVFNISPAIKTNKLIVYSEEIPKSSDDTIGDEGEHRFDDDYIYVKTSNGWRRSKLEKF